MFFDRWIKDEKGSALAMVLIIMLVLGILGTAFMNLSVAENRFVQRSEDKLQAYYIARSGAQAVAEYMVKDNNDDADDMIGHSTGSNTQIGGGEFTVSVEQDPNHTNIVNVVSTGVYKGITQTSKIQVYKTSTGVGGLFNHAIVAQSGIVANNGQGTIIKGSVAVMDEDGDLDMNKAKTIPSNNYGYDSTIVLPQIVLPSMYNHDFGNTINLNGDQISLPMSGHMPLRTDRGVSEFYYHANDITMKNGGLRGVDNTGADGVGTIIHLYVEGDIDLDTNSYITSDEHTYFYVYVKGEHTVSLIGSGMGQNVYLYAPDSDIIWSSAQPNLSLIGGIVGKNVELKNQLEISHNSGMSTYSELDVSNVGIEFTGYKWID